MPRARERRNLRRSRSLKPPQIPNFSPLDSACSRQSSRTTHPRQTSFASRVEAPRSGKKRSGSTPMQFAWRCQAFPWRPYNSVTASTGPPPSPRSGSNVVTTLSSSNIFVELARGGVISLLAPRVGTLPGQPCAQFVAWRAPPLRRAGAASVLQRDSRRERCRRASRVSRRPPGRGSVPPYVQRTARVVGAAQGGRS